MIMYHPVLGFALTVVAAICLSANGRARAQSAVPSAAEKPLVPSRLAGVQPADGTWPFQYTKEESQRDCLLDLRTLNEEVAGQSGFVGRSADGNDFVLGDGSPVRFWAVNDFFLSDGKPARFWDESTADGRAREEQLEHHARWLAKLGVNMARISGTTLNSKQPGSDATDLEEQAIRDCWRTVAAMKKQGIYSTLMPYWAGHAVDATNWSIDGYSGQTKLWGLLFWTVQGIKPPQKALLGRQFGQWLKKKYGSFDAVLKAWNGDALKGDDLASETLDLYMIYEATRPQSGGKARRIADQVQFFAETQHNFNAEMERYLREELGCRQLIAAENWRTADQARLLDAERWSYTANQVIAKNHYFNGIHVGPQSGWNIRRGDLVADRTVLTNSRALPVNYKQVVGHPHVITESTWVPPNLYQSEGPFLVAAYGSIVGLDGFYWFAFGGATEYEEGMAKWGGATPEIAGMFPAAALAYRLGYVRRGTPVVHEERPLVDLFNGTLPAIYEDEGFDPNRDTDRFREEVAATGKADPLAFLVGPVETVYGGDPAKNSIAETSPWIDSKNKIIHSSTGELAWDYGVGVCTINAPKAQDACGFLKQAGPIRLADVQLDSADPYASVLVVPLDDLQLKESKKVLIQVGTTARPTGWKTEPATTRPAGAKADIDCERVLDVGRAPWLIANTHLTVRVANAALTKAVLLDESGVPLREVELEREDATAVVKVPAETMYLILSE